VPEGQVLVVLDVDWRTVASPTTFLQGRVHVFGIRLGGAPHPDVFRSGVLIDANLSAASFWQGSAALAAGFEVHPGVEICPHASAEASLSSAVNTVTGLTLRGYLVKAK
jgi:hypothetical protein